MYRDYEDVYILEERLKDLKEEYKTALEENADEDILINLYNSIEELRQRINFAWQDEYEE
jgi:hypothetical protein